MKRQWFLPFKLQMIIRDERNILQLAIFVGGSRSVMEDAKRIKKQKLLESLIYILMVDEGVLTWYSNIYI